MGEREVGVSCGVLRECICGDFLSCSLSGLRGLYLYYSTVAVLRVFPGTALSK